MGLITIRGVDHSRDNDCCRVGVPAGRETVMFDNFFNLPREKRVGLLKSANIADDGRVRLNMLGNHKSLCVGVPGGDCVEITQHGIIKKGTLPLADKSLLKQVIGIMRAVVSNAKHVPPVKPEAVEATKSVESMAGHRDCVTCGNDQCNSCDENYSNYR